MLTEGTEAPLILVVSGHHLGSVDAWLSPIYSPDSWGWLCLSIRFGVTLHKPSPPEERMLRDRTWLKGQRTPRCGPRLGELSGGN